MAKFEPFEAAALERSYSIETSAVVAHVLMTTALVHVHASIASRRERIAVMAGALETSIQICAFAVPTYSIPLVALVDVCLKNCCNYYRFLFFKLSQ